ncbi:MAG: dephospho-CoA kinase [Aquificota bacterium]|nr:dephospho-CoA kinase [Aquificota bacterium]
MKKVALTGNLGSGKSTVGEFFGKLGAVVIDADRVIHSFYRKGHPVLDEVVRLLGKGILDPEGNADRRKIADIVFKDPEKLSELERITHSALYRELESIYSRLPEDSVVFVEASLLIEKGTYRDYDFTVVVYAPYEVCRKRAIRRGMSEEDFLRRWKRQMPPEEKVKFADFVIDNSGTLEETLKQAEEVFLKIRRDP